jgi:chromosome segregation ATPase
MEERKNILEINAANRKQDVLKLMERLEEFEQELEIKSERVERKEREMENLKLCLDRRGEEAVREINPADIQLLEAKVNELQRQNELLNSHNNNLRNKHKNLSNPGSISLSRNSSLLDEEAELFEKEESLLKGKIQEVERAIERRQEGLKGLGSAVQERQDNCFRLKEMLDTLQIEKEKNAQDKLRLELLGHQLADKISSLKDYRDRLRQGQQDYYAVMADKTDRSSEKNEATDELMWEISQLKLKLTRLENEVSIAGVNQ